MACALSLAGACSAVPPLQARLQYQLQAARTPSDDCDFAASGGINTTITAVPFTGGAAVAPNVWDIDVLMETVCAPGGSNDENVAAVNAVHAAGGKALCYVSAGTDEPFRPDHQAFLDFDAGCGGCLLGEPVAGFAEEVAEHQDRRGQRTFILGRAWSKAPRPVRERRVRRGRFRQRRGLPQPHGLPISESSQLLFNTALREPRAHERAAGRAQERPRAQVEELLPYFDFAVDEQCQQYDECETLDPFVAAGKAVFQVEYQVAAGTTCPAANAANRNAFLKSVDLFDVPWTPCR